MSSWLFQFILAVLHGCRILIPQPEIKPVIPAVEAWSPNHWTAREVPRYISCFTCSNQLSWFLLSTSPTSPVIFFYFLFISGNIMFQLLKPKLRFLRLLSVYFSLPHPTDQQDLHVLPPKNEFNHVSAFLYLFPHHWGESLPTGPTMSILEPPSKAIFQLAAREWPSSRVTLT